jgi:hypothetical protein
MPAARQFAERLLKQPRRAATATKHVVDSGFIGPRLY